MKVLETNISLQQSGRKEVYLEADKDRAMLGFLALLERKKGEK